MVADKGYHSDRVLLGLEEAGQAAHIPEPRRAERDFEGKPETERVVQGNRERVASPAGKRLQKLRMEKVERSMAHMYETGGMRGCTCGGGRTFASGCWYMPADSTWEC